MDSDRPDDQAAPPPPEAGPGDQWSLDPPAGAKPADEESAASTSTSPPRGRRRAVVAVIVAVALVAGGGAAVAFFGMRGSDEELLGKIPDDADVVVAAYLDPSAGQKANLFRMAAQFPGLRDQGDLRRRLDDALDSALETTGLDHNDVGWVGVEVALFVDIKDGGQEPAIGILVDSDDDAAARKALDRAEDRSTSDGVVWHTTEHDGVTISAPSDPASGPPALALFDGTVVLGSTEDVVASIIDTSRGSHAAIRDAPAFADTLAKLPSGKLALVYANVQPIFQMIQDSMGGAGVSGTPNPFAAGDIAAIRSVGITISAEPDGLAMDAVTLYDESKLSTASRDALSAPDHPNRLLEMVPADAYGMFAAEHYDRSLQQALDQIASSDPRVARALERAGVSGADGLLAHLTGDIAVESSPNGLSQMPGGALLAAVDDPAAAGSALDTLMRSLPLGTTTYTFKNGDFRDRQRDVVWKTETYHGTDVTFAASGADAPVAYGVVGDVAVVATAKSYLERLIDLPPGLADDPSYRSAIEGIPASDAVLYVDVAGILAAVRAQLDPASRAQFDDQVGSNVAPVRSVVLGAEGDATSQRTRLLVRIP